MNSDKTGDRILNSLLKTLQLSLQYGDSGMYMNVAKQISLFTVNNYYSHL